MANALAPKGKRYKVEDWMPDFGAAPKRRQTPAEMAAILRQSVVINRGTITEKVGGK